MATALHDHFGWAVSAVAPAQHGAPSQLFSAIALLVGARAVAVGSLDHETGAIDRYAADGGPLDPALDRLLLTINADSTPVFGSDPSAQWLEERGGQAALRLRFVRHTASLVLVLQFDEALALCRPRIEALLPALSGAVALAWAQEREKCAAHDRERASISALNDSSYGMIALDEQHRPFIINREAETFVAENLVQLRRGRLRPVEHEEAVRFELAVDAMIEAGRVGRREEARVMLLSAGANRGALMAIIAPVEAEEGATVDTRPAALVYLYRPGSSDLRGLDVLGELMGLSGAEVRLIAQLLLGRTLSEASAVLKIKLETARSYLKQIFAKTNTHRQADLLAKVQRHMPGIRARYCFRAA